IFVRYKISVSATEGLVQHTLQKIWTLSEFKNGFVFGKFVHNGKKFASLIQNSCKRQDIRYKKN
ncbi:hypothetical protein, partial [Flavobacterium macacae]|uniref:hypothetical protein n=1 Tax=Flavobacterium macacae TaxID=2488993 RepID=UPI001F2D0D93